MWMEPFLGTPRLCGVLRCISFPSFPLCAPVGLTGAHNLFLAFKAIAANDPYPDVRATAELAEGQLDGGG